MDPPIHWLTEVPVGLPRTRGDGPAAPPRFVRLHEASPHTRGWTRDAPQRLSRLRGFPAHAGMDRGRRAGATWGWRLPRTRGDGPQSPRTASFPVTASPHTRGWTRKRDSGIPRPAGFPAHAGMDLTPVDADAHTFGLPRTRGDGPRSRAATTAGVRASPHTRGWTRISGSRRGCRTGFPAHAGMDPLRPADQLGRGGLPRTRGDGPCR